jgi:hypothetical protein
MIRAIFSNNTNYDADTNSSTDTVSMSVSIPSQVVFYIFLLLDIPSVLCSLLLFYYFISLRELRDQRHSNKIIIYLLIGSFLVTAVDIPLILPYLQNYYYMKSMKYPYSFCVFWIMYDYGMYSLNLWLMALACLERYLLIFFKQLIMKNRKRRFFLYYVPVTLIILFVIFWYVYLVALYPCTQTQFDLTQAVCGFPCYKTVGSVTVQNTDWTLADLLPVFLTILVISILIIHVLYQKHKISRHLMRQETWKRTRKMFLQLLPITFIFLVFNMPLIIVGLLAISNPWYNTTPYFYVNSLSYCLSLFMPFAVLSRQITIRKRLSNLLSLRRPNQIAPTTTTALPMRLLTHQTVQKMAEATVVANGV